jgi:hypothetical protein
MVTLFLPCGRSFAGVKADAIRWVESRGGKVGTVVCVKLNRDDVPEGHTGPVVSLNENGTSGAMADTDPVSGQVLVMNGGTTLIQWHMFSRFASEQEMHAIGQHYIPSLAVDVQRDKVVVLGLVGSFSKKGGYQGDAQNVTFS